jgi:ribonuclease HI
MVSVYFDGCSKGNPGPSGAGYVIYKDGEEICSDSLYLGTQTNNFAEYSGLILALKKANSMGITEMDVYGDSMLVIRQMQGTYKVKAAGLKTLYDHAIYLSSKMKINYHHVLREKNKRADELANEALIY